MTLKSHRASLLYYAKLCASFQTIVKFKLELQSRNAQFGSKLANFCPVWYRNLSDLKLCASLHHHMWIQTGIKVRKRLNTILTFATLTFDLWPFAWTSLLSVVITPENFMMIRCWEHGEKGETDRRTGRWTDRHADGTILRAASSQ